MFSKSVTPTAKRRIPRGSEVAWVGHLQRGGDEREPGYGEDAAGRHAAGSADEEVR